MRRAASTIKKGERVEVNGRTAGEVLSVIPNCASTKKSRSAHMHPQTVMMLSYADGTLMSFRLEDDEEVTVVA